MKLPGLNLLKTYGFELPERYHNTLFIANSSLFQVVGYFVHRSYQAIMNELVDKCQKMCIGVDEQQASEKVKEKIREIEFCDQFVDFNFPVRRSHGGMDIVRGMRVYHGGCLNYGMSLGGFRLVEDLQRHTIQGYAADATYKNACFELDMMGSHGGLKICKNLYNQMDLKVALQTFIRKLSAQKGFVDLIEPDVFCTAEEMQHMHDVCDNNILIMGKPQTIGGIDKYKSAGAKAAIQVLKIFMDSEDIMKRINLVPSLKGKTFILHGMGTLGIEIATRMAREGALCVGVRDEECFLYDTSGIPIKPLVKHYKKFGSFLSFSTKAKENNGDKIFHDLCDILILASAERAISCHTADRIKAKVILEACNGPITPAADKILTDHSRLIIPSILSGSGSTLMSYMEYLKNSSSISPFGDAASESENINMQIENKYKQVVADVIAIEKSLDLKLNFRTAAYIKSIRRIFHRMMENEALAQEGQLKQRMYGMQ